LEHEVIAPGDSPPVIRRTLIGNAGCPYAADALDNPAYAGLPLADPASPTARLGCSFCFMGGDYQKRSDGQVVEELVEQAAYICSHDPLTREFVLSDQAPLRYLSTLMRAAKEAGVPPVRWLFAARPDVFVRQLETVREAATTAGELGDVLELYLSGFEAFSEAELRRYNKGTTGGDQLAAVSAMRELATELPAAFDYATARGHSLILWNPWTTPEDLRESVENLRRHGLGQLFHELGRNRLRLYDELPIARLAVRDGLVEAEWEGEGGAGRRKGYNVERPWRFADARTSVAYGLARWLRDALGGETEIAQLRAILGYVEQTPPHAPDEAVARISVGIHALEAALERFLGPQRAASEARRAAQVDAAVVELDGPCNNGCEACSQRDVWRPRESKVVLRRVREARARALENSWGLCIGGREPTLREDLPALVEEAVGSEPMHVAVVSNGRRFAYAAYARELSRAGLGGASIKLFGPRADIADAIARVEGSFDQASQGLVNLQALGVETEIRVPLAARNLDDIDGYARLASKLRVRQLRLEVALDAVGLLSLDAAADAVERLGEACRGAGLGFEVSPLRRGSRGFNHVPASPARKL
jgi:pyruvate-formate lyase-activating enzyme